MKDQNLNRLRLLANDSPIVHAMLSSVERARYYDEPLDTEDVLVEMLVALGAHNLAITKTIASAFACAPPPTYKIEADPALKARAEKAEAELLRIKSGAGCSCHLMEGGKKCAYCLQREVPR